MVRPHVVIADDHPQVAVQLRHLIEDDFDVLAVASNGAELVEVVQALKPDVVVTDISMPGLDGLQAARLIGDLMPGVRIIFVTMHNDPALARSALQVGHGFVLKSAAGDELLDALRIVLDSGSFISPSLQYTEPH